MNAIDAVLLVAAALFGYTGFRQGFVVGILSMVGFLTGGTLVLLIAPHVLVRGDTSAGELLLAVALALTCAAVGQLVFARIGHLLRRRIAWAPVHAIDAVAGAAMSLVVVLVVSWFFASALRPGPSPALSRQISDSVAITAIDRIMPERARTAFSEFRRLLDDNPLPPVFGGLQPERVRPIEAPPREVAQGPAIRSAVRSVVQVTSAASRCTRRVKGSGFVFAREHVMTNAHVVAGVRRPEVAVGGKGRRYPARVVAYDHARDVAVLYVPGLRAAPLQFRQGAERGDPAVVAGFPQGGGFRLGAARIRDTVVARGPDIYHRRQVSREVFSLHADVEPGNSGGPLLSPDGKVYGVVFAKSLDHTDTGYALTAREVRPVVATAGRATARVGTGACL